MKTIERAKEAAGLCSSCSISTVTGCSECENRGFYFGYIDGATEQRKIDIDKACEWLSAELNQLAMDKLNEDFLRNNFKVILKEQVPEWVERFRKAMEL